MFKSIRLMVVALICLISFTSFQQKVQEDSGFVMQPNEFFEWLQEQNNDTVFINFWATWCRPCVEEMPDITQALQETGTKHLIVSLDDSGISDLVQSFIKQRAWVADFALVDVTDFDDFINKIDPKWQGEIPTSVLLIKDKKKSHYSMFRSKDEVIDFIRN